MRQFTQKEFIKILIFNGFQYARHNGSHAVYINNKGKNIAVPTTLKCVIAHRLIKENNLDINIKKSKYNG